MCVGRMTGYSVGFEGGRKGWTDWSLSAVECDSATPPVAGTTDWSCAVNINNSVRKTNPS